ncbi:MAG: DUF4293 domain-containing protein [Microscillaceae bacterium]|nr:DUF4293 domain-containing protein [Microscillaceae bacterium]MDW8461353.1 DUF4293 family protein [Cytophagales bacterium]
MLQRPQNIFLILIIVFLLVGSFFPVWHKENKKLQQKVGLTYGFYSHQKLIKQGEATQSKTNSQFSFLSILAGIVICVAGYSFWIGQKASIAPSSSERFKKRLLQMKLGLFISLLLSGMLGLIIYFTIQGEALFPDEVRQSHSLAKYQVGFYLTVLALIANLFANRFIRKEQQLVSSSDRLR